MRPATPRPTPIATADIELRSAIDNPTVLPDGRVESCGHFHGAPVGLQCDFLAIACAEVGSIAERRTDRLLDRTRSHGLPPFLVEDAGVNSGLMIVQYTQAAMVAENRRLGGPGERRLDPDVGDAGGSRVDGVERSAQAAPIRRATSGGSSPASSSARPVDSTSAPRFGRRPATPRRSPPSVTPAWPATARTAGRRPSWPSPKRW